MAQQTNNQKACQTVNSTIWIFLIVVLVVVVGILLNKKEHDEREFRERLDRIVGRP